MAQIHAIVVAARAVTSVASECRMVSAKLQDLVAHFALDLPVLRNVPALDTDDVQIGVAASQVILGVADHLVLDDDAFNAFVAHRTRRAGSVHPLGSNEMPASA